MEGLPTVLNHDRQNSQWKPIFASETLPQRDKMYKSWQPNHISTEILLFQNRFALKKIDVEIFQSRVKSIFFHLILEITLSFSKKTQNFLWLQILCPSLKTDEINNRTNRNCWYFLLLTTWKATKGTNPKSSART